MAIWKTKPRMIKRLKTDKKCKIENQSLNPGLKDLMDTKKVDKRYQIAF